MNHDYEEVAVGLDHLRETLRAMVAGLMTDGFNEEQARQIATAIMTREIP